MRHCSRVVLTALLGCLFGLAQGMRHALEPDHIVALSTMIGDERTARGRIAYATSWGAGHGLVLFAVGAVLLVVRRAMPARMEAVFEVGVGVMLVALGVRALVGARRALASHAHAEARSSFPVARPLAIGIVHGLAGSGALTALAMSQLPGVAAALVFVALFGIGATAAMALLAGAAGAPLGRIVRNPLGLRALLATTGLLSVGLGVASIVAMIVRSSA